jgi:hypothetical protein
VRSSPVAFFHFQEKLRPVSQHKFLVFLPLYVAGFFTLLLGFLFGFTGTEIVNLQVLYFLLLVSVTAVTVTQHSQHPVTL